MSSMRSRKKTLRSLRFALKKRNAEHVREVLRLRPSLRNPDGGQMLWSVIAESPEIAAMLVRAGADLGERDPTDNSSLLLRASARCDHEEYERLALLMLERGVNVNFRTTRGDTALHLAVRHESVPLIEALVERGLSVDIVNLKEETAICMTARCSRIREMLRMMVDQPPVDAGKRNRRVLDAIEFLICSESDETVAIKELLNLGVNVNERSDCGLTPLSLAVARGKSNLLEMLMAFGSDMNQLMLEGNLPIVRSSYMEQSLLLNLLRDQGASVNARDEYSRNRLHVVCACSKFMHPRNIQLLLHLGADVNAVDNWGNTPFALMDAESLGDSRQLYVKHLALMFWKGAVISDNDMMLVRKDPKASRFYEDCLDELARMKDTGLHNDFSMFDVLVKSSQRLSTLARYSVFVDAFNEKKPRFPMYSRDLEIAFEIAVNRRDVLLLSEITIEQLTRRILPTCAVEKIACYVCFDELREKQREFYFDLWAQTNVREKRDDDMAVD